MYSNNIVNFQESTPISMLTDMSRVGSIKCFFALAWSKGVISPGNTYFASCAQPQLAEIQVKGEL